MTWFEFLDKHAAGIGEIFTFTLFIIFWIIRALIDRTENKGDK